MIEASLGILICAAAIAGSTSLESSVTNLPSESPARVWVDALGKGKAAKSYDQIKGLFSKRMRDEAGRMQPAAAALAMAQMSANLLLAQPRELVDRFKDGQVAILKTSNLRFVKDRPQHNPPRLGETKSIYFQRLVHEDGHWRLDAAKEITESAGPEPTARDMAETLDEDRFGKQ